MSLSNMVSGIKKMFLQNIFKNILKENCNKKKYLNKSIFVIENCLVYYLAILIKFFFCIKIEFLAYLNYKLFWLKNFIVFYQLV